MAVKKPTALKILHGNPGKRALNHEEPVPENAIGEPPAFLCETAKSIWQHVIDEVPEGVLKSTDVVELTIFCAAFALYKKALEHIAAEGAMVSVMKDGIMLTRKNPWVEIMNEQARVLQSSGANLGLSPVARSRLSLPGAKKPQAKVFG